MVRCSSALCGFDGFLFCVCVCICVCGWVYNCALGRWWPFESGYMRNHLQIQLDTIIQQVSQLTGISKVLILVVRSKQDIVLGGFRLFLGKVLVLDLSELDHCAGCVEFNRNIIIYEEVEEKRRTAVVRAEKFAVVRRL